jgi:hypothetical protein
MWWVKKILAHIILWTPVVCCLLLLSFCAGLDTPDDPILDVYTTVFKGLVRIALAVIVLAAFGVLIYWADKTIEERKPHGS